MIKVGDKVKIAKDSPYYGYSHSNPKDIIGEVDYVSEGLDEHSVLVRWTEEVHNSYRITDLVDSNDKPIEIIEKENNNKNPKISFELKGSDIGDIVSVIYQYSSGTSRIMSLIKGPTNNCQIMLLKPAQKLFDSIMFPCIESQEQLMRDLLRYCSKNQILIDINAIYEDKIEAIFGKENINIKTPYQNTGGMSKMILYLFKMDKFRTKIQ